MKKIKIEKSKQSLIIGYMFLILMVINLSNYKSTVSKYLKENDEALVYQDSLYEVYKGHKIAISYRQGSDNTNLYINVEFKRNSDIGENITQDIYQVNLPSVCTITNITAPNANRYSISDQKIYYTNQKNDTINIQATCKIDQSITSNQDIIINALVKEKVNNDVSYFTYLDNTETFKDYLNQEFRSLYNQLLSWVENEYYPRYVDNNEALKLNAANVKIDIRNYIFVYNDIQPGEAYPTIKGLEITYDAATHKYSFATTKNFIGYAATSYVNSVTPSTMYFTTFDNTKEDIPDNTLLNNLFYEYLTTYFYPDNDNALNIIKNYIDALNLPNGIADYIKNGQPNIRGLKWVNDQEIEVSNLLNNILNQNQSPIEIASDSSSAMNKAFSKAFLEDTEVYGPHGEYGNLISDALRTEVTTQTTLGFGLYNSYTKNNSGKYNADGSDGKAPYLAFNDYFITYDAEKADYVLFRIYSDGKADEAGNALNRSYLQILDFKQEEVNISFSNNVNTSDIAITITSTLGKEKILEVVRALDELWEINSFTADEFNYADGFSDDYNLTYTLSKADLNQQN